MDPNDSMPAAPATTTLDDLFPKDADLVDDGVIFELTGTSALHVRRNDNRQFQGFVETLQKKHRFQFDHELVTEDDKVKLLIPGVAKHLLVGWTDFPPEAPVPYSAKKAEELLRERRSLFYGVIRMSKESKAFIREREEAAAKN